MLWVLIKQVYLEYLITLRNLFVKNLTVTFSIPAYPLSYLF